MPGWVHTKIRNSYTTRPFVPYKKVEWMNEKRKKKNHIKLKLKWRICVKRMQIILTQTSCEHESLKRVSYIASHEVAYLLCINTGQMHDFRLSISAWLNQITTRQNNATYRVEQRRCSWMIYRDLDCHTLPTGKVNVWCPAKNIYKVHKERSHDMSKLETSFT